VKNELLDLPYDPLLEEGARNAVQTCLDVQPDERVALFTDRATLEVGAALATQLVEAAEELEVVILEDVADRPLTYLPAVMERALERADVSIFAASALPGELAMRRIITSIVGHRSIRHGHMVGIDGRIMLEGMRANYEEVARLTEWVRARAEQAREITCETPAGTALRATLDPAIPWIPTPGIISPRKWGNLPGGETFTAPARVDGIFVVDGVLGTWLAPKHGDMRDCPLTITIVDSRIVGLECESEAALEDFRRYTSTDQNSDRVGEFALGTNTAIRGLIGNMLQDEKFPGVHIAFGHPYSEHTGADWHSSTHIDVVGRDFDVWFDGRPIMKRSRYLTNGTI
jgi:leucyl aminopeptidase (aminopeptidase T)